MACPEIPKAVDDSVDAHLIAYAATIGLYDECAKRHKALIDWIEN